MGAAGGGGSLTSASICVTSSTRRSESAESEAAVSAGNDMATRTEPQKLQTSEKTRREHTENERFLTRE